MLTETEIQVLRLKEKGLPNMEIAKRLRIAQPAVYRSYKNALKKMKDTQVIRIQKNKRGKLEIEI